MFSLICEIRRLCATGVRNQTKEFKNDPIEVIKNKAEIFSLTQHRTLQSPCSLLLVSEIQPHGFLTSNRQDSELQHSVIAELKHST